MSKKKRKNKIKTKESSIINPSYYNVGDEDLLHFINKVWGPEALEHVVFFNVIKYNTRWDKKNGVEDLMKANKYINRYMELMRDNYENKKEYTKKRNCIGNYKKTSKGDNK